MATLSEASWLVCGLLWLASCSNGLVGTPSRVRWTQDSIVCNPDSLVVIEEAYYGMPAPQVCDGKCRLGPEAENDECYFADKTCVQRASHEDVSQLYDFCWPATAPSSCNFSGAGVPESLVVWYSCLDGNIFDPYNRTFTWKGYRMAYAFRLKFIPSTPMVSHCHVISDARTPSIKVTALKSPFWEHEQTSPRNDITFLFDNVTRTVEESPFPKWWIVTENDFVMRFIMAPTSSDFHPFWVLLEDSQEQFEIMCSPEKWTPGMVTIVPVTSENVTSPNVTGTNDSQVHEEHLTFSLTDLLLSVMVTAVGIIIIVVIIVCLIRIRRRRREDEESNYASLIERIEYRNQGADAVAMIGSNARGTNNSGPSRRCFPSGGDPPELPNRLQPGSGISNGLYGQGLSETSFNKANPAQDNRFCPGESKESGLQGAVGGDWGCPTGEKYEGDGGYETPVTMVR